MKSGLGVTEVSSFDRLHTSSDWRSTVNAARSCIVSEIKQQWSKVADFYIPHLHSRPIRGRRRNFAVIMITIGFSMYHRRHMFISVLLRNNWLICRLSEYLLFDRMIASASTIHVHDIISLQGVSEKSRSPAKTFWNIFTSVKSFWVKFCRFVGNSYLHISTNFCRFILIFHQMALIFPRVPIVFTMSSFE